MSRGVAAVTDSRVYNGGIASAVAVTPTRLPGTDTVSGTTQQFVSKNVLGAAAA